MPDAGPQRERGTAGPSDAARSDAARSDAARRADHAAISRLAEDLLPALIAKLGAFVTHEDGWSRVFAAVASLRPEDLTKTVHVRGEAHSVMEAINRQTSHYAAHVGQIVLLAKHYAGSNWQTLSIPRGMSNAFDVSKSGAPYKTKS